LEARHRKNQKIQKERKNLMAAKQETESGNSGIFFGGDNPPQAALYEIRQLQEETEAETE